MSYQYGGDDGVRRMFIFVGIEQARAWDGSRTAEGKDL